MAKKILIVANWKANPATKEEASSLARKMELVAVKLNMVKTVIAPSFPFLQTVKSKIKKIALGAQDGFWTTGPYTGEVPAEQLKSLGVKYVIVGHSERKIYFQETDEMINKKISALLKNKIKVVLCVGERERIDANIPEIVGEQLRNALRGIRGTELKNLIVAYEPVWAISSNANSRPDTPENSHQASIYIRKIIAGLYGEKASRNTPIIYGGSINASNIRSFMREAKMDGALVGKAGLDPRGFAELLKAASERL